LQSGRKTIENSNGPHTLFDWPARRIAPYHKRDMRATPLQTLAAIVILLALGTLTLSMAIGGDILTIILGLALAATSMELFRQAQPHRDDKD
jgi:hypothetical protein